MSGPAEQFSNELYELISRWRDKVIDDQLTLREIVGIFEVHKHLLILEAIGLDRAEREDEDEERER